MMGVQEQVRRIPIKDALVPVLERSVRTCLPTPSTANLGCEGPIWCWVSQYEVGADVVSVRSAPADRG